jgi:hypothetical protein
MTHAGERAALDRGLDQMLERAERNEAEVKAPA